jgi:hypothetical protein
MPDQWYLFIPSIPAKPSSLRVKTWRRMRKIGAVPLRQSVYVLPPNERALEDLLWTRRSLSGEGGDAVILSAEVIDGVADAEIRSLFHDARNEEYAALLEEAKELERQAEVVVQGQEDPARLRAQLERLRRRLDEVTQIDFFGAQGRGAVETLVSSIGNALNAGSGTRKERGGAGKDRGSFRKRTWATRAGVYVDRIASAWLIRRFIDPEATFRFLAPGERGEAGDIRFDMADAEYTHRGALCTFEVLIEAFGLADENPGLGPLSEIIHDIDLKETSYAREETAGVQSLFTGIATSVGDDQERIDRGGIVLDGLLEYFSTRSSRA